MMAGPWICLAGTVLAALLVVGCVGGAPEETVPGGTTAPNILLSSAATATAPPVVTSTPHPTSTPRPTPSPTPAVSPFGVWQMEGWLRYIRNPGRAGGDCDQGVHYSLWHPSNWTGPNATCEEFILTPDGRKGHLKVRLRQLRGFDSNPRVAAGQMASDWKGTETITTSTGNPGERRTFLSEVINHHGRWAVLNKFRTNYENPQVGCSSTGYQLVVLPTSWGAVDNEVILAVGTWCDVASHLEESMVLLLQSLREVPEP